MRLFAIIISIFLSQAAKAAPMISLDLNNDTGIAGVPVGLQILILLTILSVAPSILLMTTCFVRFIIVFGMLRTALGVGQLPPTQILVGLSLVLTFVVMQPTFNSINEEAIKPFIAQQINEQQFIKKAINPLRKFMMTQTGEKELIMAFRISEIDRPQEIKDTPVHILSFAYMLSELRKAFQIGFMIYLPFVIIDMVVATAIVSIGLMFLPPTTISLPFKLVLFVLIDGWSIISEGLIRGVQGG